MHVATATANPHVDLVRRRRRTAANTPEQVRTLPMRVAAGVRVSAPKWMFIVGGGLVGALLLGPLGAVGGALAGALLAR